MIGQQPAMLAHHPKSRGVIEIRSTYLDGQTNTVHYTEGIDYEINRGARTIIRTANSRIPDFQTNILDTATTAFSPSSIILIIRPTPG
jgi:hypothetical protein